MQLNVFKQGVPLSRAPLKILIIMKMIIVMMTVVLVQAQANVLAQRVSLNKSDVPLLQIMEDIREQTGFDFLVLDYELVSRAKNVSIQVNNAELSEELPQLLEKWNSTYALKEQSIIIKEAPEITSKVVIQQEIRGNVINERGEPVSSATIQLVTADGSRIGNQVISGSDGKFVLRNVVAGAKIQCSHLNYETKTVDVSNNTVTIVLRESVSKLDDVVVIGYGEQKRADLTGSIGSVNVSDLQKAPVASIDEALAGRVAGV